MNIYDIASKSGVSVSTVSRVINGNSHVREETRERVMQIIRDTGFQPNAFAQGLNYNSIGMVGVLCTDFGDTFFSSAVAGLERHLRAANMNVTLVCTGKTAEGQKEGIRSLQGKNVDAIVLVGAGFYELPVDYLAAAETTPIFAISMAMYDIPNIYCVCCDERSAVQEAVGLLIKEQHPSVLFVCEHRESGNNGYKLRGYAGAYEQLGLSSPDLVLVTGDSEPQAETLIYEYLSKNLDKVDAVMTGNDLLGAYVLKSFHRLGVMRPVVGFNNSMFTHMMLPELSSVDNHLDEMCRITAERLDDVLHKKTVPSKTIITGDLVRRESF